MRHDMKIEPFKLERWLLEKAEYDLGGGGVVKLQLKDVTTSLDYDQYMKYGRTDGSDSLKRQVADWYDVDPDNILITSGTSEANLLVNLCLIEKGDGYLTEYPQYEQTSGFAKCLGAKVGSYHLDEESHWRLNLEELMEKAVRGTRIIFLDNPNNPTGALLSKSEMRAICDVAGDVGAYVHCDNALRGSEADGKPALTPFGLYDRGIVTGSISKLGATSPRIGWIIAEREIIDRCWIMKDYTTLSHSGLGEYLAEIILRNRRRYIERNLAIRRTNTEMMSNWIRENGDLVSWTRPEAGFTAFPRYHRRTGSTEFCKRLLEEERILLSPGDHFGVDNHLRINIGSKREVLAEALPRLERFIESLPQ